MPGRPRRMLIAAGPATSNLQYLVTDGKGDLVIDTGTNPPSTTGLMTQQTGSYMLEDRSFSPVDPQPEVPPRQRRWFSIGLKRPGRFLVICANRNHLINDWMFGFVDVVGGDLD